MDATPVQDLYFPVVIMAILLVTIGSLVADLRLAHIISSEQSNLDHDELRRIKTTLLRQNGMSQAAKAQDMRDVGVDGAVAEGHEAHCGVAGPAADAVKKTASEARNAFLRQRLPLETGSTQVVGGTYRIAELQPICTQSYAFQAVNELPKTAAFKLLLSFDYPSGTEGAWVDMDVVDVLRSYGPNGAYFHADAKPMVSNFEGPSNSNIQDWSYINGSIPVPSQFVEIVTWNDFGESHYVGPIYQVGPPDSPTANTTAHVDGYPRQTWLRTLPYQIAACKHAYNPAADLALKVAEDKVVFGYRNAPAKAGRTEATGNDCNSDVNIYGYQTCCEVSEVLEDGIFAIVLATKSVTAEIAVGSGQTTVFSGLTEGINFISRPFAGETGVVKGQRSYM
ncbi:hypothetical protein B0A55_07716 [Friedmanniomyces simplex]|uniref:Uncharacterized protein n=1 Tax=Friedmanniomyces simplex TaxID=329884 RepID=A0A4U0X7D1_9PEZI|nr:hypothetical protein B0A55_07716 [Friedmanniomyces simplex]